MTSHVQVLMIGLSCPSINGVNHRKVFGSSRFITRVVIWVSPSSCQLLFASWRIASIFIVFRKIYFFLLRLSRCFLGKYKFISRPHSEFALIRGWTLVLYGSVISPQKDDEPRQSSSSPNHSYNNNNNNYSLNTLFRPNANNYGTTSLYNNRNQQKSTTTVPAQAGARKNGKQKNGKGNKNNQRTSTTARPIYTTVMLNQFSIGSKSTKNKSKANQNTSNASVARLTTTTRPRTTTSRMPNMKNHLGFGKNNDLLSLKLDKVEPANSNLYEKSPGKAPKQVKEGSYTTPPPHDTRPSPNLSMSQMFERYEKIEQIFPELKPYKDNNPAYFTVTNGNGKPSRENSKSFSSFVSAPQKKNSPSDISTATRQQVLSQTANEKNAKGTNTKSIYLSPSQLLVVVFSLFISHRHDNSSFCFVLLICCNELS